MIGQAIAVMLLVAGIFFAGTQYAKNRFMSNMMKDLVEVKDMDRWLKIWT